MGLFVGAPPRRACLAAADRVSARVKRTDAPYQQNTRQNLLRDTPRVMGDVEGVMCACLPYVATELWGGVSVTCDSPEGDSCVAVIATPG